MARRAQANAAKGGAAGPEGALSLSLRPSISQPFYLSPSLSLSLSISRSFYLSASLSLALSISQPRYLSPSLSLTLPLHLRTCKLMIADQRPLLMPCARPGKSWLR